MFVKKPAIIGNGNRLPPYGWLSPWLDSVHGPHQTITITGLRNSLWGEFLKSMKLGNSFCERKGAVNAALPSPLWT